MPRGDFKRWLYRGGSPHGLARLLNRSWAVLAAWGMAPESLVQLQVKGRKSGHEVSLPLVLAEVDGQRYLVSMLGEAAWVKNVRAAAGEAVLQHGRREEVHLEEVPVEQRAAIVKAYLQQAPGARPHLSVDKDAPLSAFTSIVPAIPVFRVFPRGAGAAVRRYNDAT